jgi:hypothetical protein
MSGFVAGGLSTAGSTTLPVFALVGSASVRARVKEIGVFNTTSTAVAPPTTTDAGFRVQLGAAVGSGFVWTFDDWECPGRQRRDRVPRGERHRAGDPVLRAVMTKSQGNALDRPFRWDSNAPAGLTKGVPFRSTGWPTAPPPAWTRALRRAQGRGRHVLARGVPRQARARRQRRRPP